jgi:gliding motility-associated-like protein
MGYLYKTIIPFNFKMLVNSKLLLIILFFSGIAAFAQCPTVTNLNQSFCDIQSPTIASLQAVNNGGGIAWYATDTSTTPLTPGFGLVNGEDYFADNSTGNCGSRIRVVVTIYSAPTGQNFQGPCVDSPEQATIASLIAIGNNVQWYNVPSGGSPLPQSTVLIPNTIYYASQTNPDTGCQTSRLSVFVSIGVVPVPTGAAVQTFCQDPLNPPTVADLDASGDNNWYLTSSSALPLELNTPLIDGQTYYATTVDPPCESDERLEVLVSIQPQNNAGSDGIISFCEDNLSTSLPINLFDSLGGNPFNTGIWSGPIVTSNGSLGTLDLSQLSLSGSPYVFTYSVNSSTECPPASSTVTVIINEIPNAGTDGATIVCENDPSFDLFTLLGNNPEVGGSWSPTLASGTGVFDPAQDTAGVYTYTIIGTPPCENSSASITVTVNPIPNPGTAGVAPFCENGAPEDLFNYLGGTPDAGGTWSPPLASGTGVFNPAEDTAGVYTYTVNDVGPCDPQSTTVTVTINPIPNAGTSNAIVLCETDAAIDLFTLLGNNPEVGGSWSPTLASGTGVFDPAQDTAGVYTYTIIGTPPCENSSASITVTVNPIPNPGTAGVAPFCENGAPEDLFNYLGGTPDAGGTWSPPLASGTGVFDPTQDTAGVYTYTVNDLGPCDPQSTTVTVTINPIPNAGTSNAIVLCETDATIDLFTLLGNNPEVGGSWSPALASGTGVFDPSQDTAGVYTYTIIGTPPCENSSASITVTVNPIPNPGTAGVAPFCENGSPEDLFNYLGGTPDAGGTWSPPLASGTGVFDPTQDTAGVYTYTVNDLGPCDPQSTTVTVTINPIPNAGTSNAIVLCETDATIDLFTLLGNNPEVGGSWSPALASGTGVFDPSQDTAGVYTYTIIGTPPCANSSASITVTVNPIPNPGIAGSAPFCENGSPEDLFNYLGGTPDAGGTWSPPLASGTGVFDPSQDTAGVYTYTVNGIFPCDPQSTTVTVTINPIPNAGTSNAIVLCETDAAIDLFTLLGNNPEVGGSWSPALVSGTGVFDPSQDTAGVYTYTIIGTPPCENSSASITVTVNPIPNPGEAGVAPFCENSPADDLFNYLGGTPDAGGTWSPPLASGTGVFDPAEDTAGVYTYTVNDLGPCDPQSTTVTVTINPIPNAGTSNAIVLCETDATIDLFTLLGNNPEVGGSWSPALASGTGVFDPSQDTAGVYTYTIIGTPPCENSSASITVTVNPIPNPGEAGVAPFCENSPADDLFNYLGGTPDAGGTWSPPLASGTGVFDPAEDTAGVYTYTVNDLGPCDPQSTTVTVTINPIPNAGTSNAIVLCETDAAIDLFTLLGNNPEVGGSWSPALASGTGVFDPSQDTAGVYTYTIIGTPPCEDSSASITVTVNPVPNPGTAGSAPFCENGAPQDLFNYLGGTPDAGGTWTPALASGTGIFDPAQDTAGVYTYTVNDLGPCDPQSTTVTVTINPIPNAGTSDAIILCETDAAINLFTLLGNNPEVGGTWSPALASGTGVFDPSQDTAGVYTYTIIGTPPCEDSSASITVTVNPVPNPGTAGSAPFCENGAPQDLFNYLGGTPDAGGTWSPPLASGTGVFDPTQDTAGVYTYTVDGDDECDPQSTTVTVTINSIPNAGTNGETTVCITDASFDLFTLLGNNPELGGSWLPTLASGTGIFNPAVDPAGIYTYSIIGTLPCEDSSATITVTIESTANAGTFTGIQSVCASEDTFDLNTLLDGSQQTGGTWTDNQGDAVANVITITNLSAGTYSYIYTVTTDCNTDSEFVQLTIIQGPEIAIEDVIVLSPICQGENSTVTIFNLADGNYSLNYSLTGSNTIDNQIVLFTVVDGEVTFEIDTAQLVNPGTTSLVFNSILNAVTNCETILTGLSFDIEILPLLNLANTNLTVQNVCLGTEVIVQISGATNLADGTYQFVYSIPNANPITGNSGDVVITGGAGQFTIPSSVFPTAGNYTLTFNSITSEVSPCTNLNPAVSVSFEVLPAATITEALVTLSALCANSDGTVSITNATNLSNGTYQLTYQIIGAITHNETISVEFLNGQTSFVIPSTILINTGEITLSINQINSNTGNACGTPGHTFNAVTLTIENVETPELIDGGNSFCEDDNATIANLISGINTDQTIIWYDAPLNGNAYSDSTVLVNGQVYYASIQSSAGCGSTVRLAVTVSIRDCTDIIIPDGFSPNDDGINDFFVIKNIRTLYPNFDLEIFNRYGNILYKGNAASQDWDGTSDKGIQVGGNKLPAGVYFFIINFNDGIREPLQGRVYLSR